MVLLPIIEAYMVGLAIFIYCVYATTIKEPIKPHPIVVKAVKISLVVVLILLVLAIALILTGIYFFGKSNVDTSYLIRIENPHNRNEMMYVNIELSGEVIAAQESLFAFVTVYPNSTWREQNQIGYSDLPKELLILFDGANCNNELPTFRLSTTCNFRLYFNNNVFTAGRPLNYLSGGQYGVHLAEYNATTTKLTSSEYFIQVESYQVTTEKTNVYVASMIGLASIGAAILLWWKRRG